MICNNVSLPLLFLWSCQRGKKRERESGFLFHLTSFECVIQIKIMNVVLTNGFEGCSAATLLDSTLKNNSRTTPKLVIGYKSSRKSKGELKMNAEYECGGLKRARRSSKVNCGC